MEGEVYRLNTATIGIVQRDGQMHPLDIPLGAIITVAAADIDSDGLVNVTCDGMLVVMMARHLKERGVQIR